MGWLPDSPDELFGAIVIVAVLGAVALVALGRVVLWVCGWPLWCRPPVKGSAQACDDYVPPGKDASTSAAPFRQERELEPEPELAEQADPPAPAPNQKLYTAEQISILQEQAREAGAAEALGRLLGRQLVAAADRTQAMELLFGPRGRRHQRVRPLVEAAAARVAPPAAEARLIPISNGDGGYVEL
jgi:hypothetical protein